MNKKFNSVLKYLPTDLSAVLNGLDEYTKDNVQEIRLRVDRLICIVTSDDILFLNRKGRPSKLNGDFYCTKNMIVDIVQKMCNHSIHSKMPQLKKGFISLDMGNRAGVCGCFIGDTSVTDYSSICIRISKEVKGASGNILRMLRDNLDKGVLIAGTPASGKTTLIRDLARSLSSGEKGRMYQVLVIDERDEIAAFWNGSPQNDIGNADVIRGSGKDILIEAGLRSMAPDFIVLDEIGNKNEAELLKECLNNGTSVIATAHLSDENQLLNRKYILDLIKADVFGSIVFLKKGRSKGAVDHVVCSDHFKDCRSNNTFYRCNAGGVDDCESIQGKT